MTEYTLQLSSPAPELAPLHSMAFDSDETKFQLSTSLNGFERCSIGGTVRTRYDLIPAWLPQRLTEDRPHAHIVVTKGLNTIWEGRRQRPSYNRGEIMGIEGLGYSGALGDAPFVVDIDATDTTGQLIRKILRDVYGFYKISPGYQDPSISHSLSEYDLMTPAQIIDQIITEGGTDGHLWMFSVWEDITALLRSRDFSAETPMYTIPFDTFLELNYNDDELWTHVAVRYTPSGGTETITAWKPDLTDTTDLGRLGLSLPKKIILNGGELTADGATAFRDAFWREHRVKRWSGRAEILAGSNDLMYYHGGLAELDSVRSGVTVQVEGMPEEEGPLLISGTDWTSHPEQLTLTIGAAPTRGADLFRRYHQMISALANGRNPISKGKAI